MARYRFVTITVTALCLVLAAFTVWFEFAAYTDYRTPDFTKVSEGPVTGTCVEAVTEDQLKAAWYDKDDWDCSDGNKENLANLLAVSVHALYEKSATLDAAGTRVLNSLVSTTQGVTGHQITKTQAYDALKMLGTPSTDCAAIYPGATELTTIPTSLDPVVVCDSETPVDGTPEAAAADKLYTHCLIQFSYGRSYQTAGTFGIPKVGEEASPMILPVIGTNSSTTWEDRSRILVGTRYAPVRNLYTHFHRFPPNLTHACFRHARSWGYSAIVYIIFAMGSAFFFMDCAILLLAELTRIDAYFGKSTLNSARFDPSAAHAVSTPN
jgi:hypothetical protein